MVVRQITSFARVYPLPNGSLRRVSSSLILSGQKLDLTSLSVSWLVEVSISGYRPTATSPSLDPLVFAQSKTFAFHPRNSSSFCPTHLLTSPISWDFTRGFLVKFIRFPPFLDFPIPVSRVSPKLRFGKDEVSSRWVPKPTLHSFVPFPSFPL